MFDWKLFTIIILICVPGVLVAVPGVIAKFEVTAQTKLPKGKRLPHRGVMLAVALVQTFFLITIASAAGTMLASRVSMGAPFFKSLAAGEPVWPALRTQLLPTLAFGVVGTPVFLAVYYGFFRPRLDPETVKAIDELRYNLGIWGRLLYGGIVEEILMRWGLMTFLVWLGTWIVGGPSTAVIWIVILITGVVFGLGHAPGVLTAGAKPSTMFYTTIIFLNLGAGTIFAWLYWQQGLVSAMIGHALFHLLWWPVDVIVHKRMAFRTSGSSNGIVAG